MSRNRKLSLLIGRWKTTGIIEKTPMGPAATLKGTDEYIWSYDGNFLIHKVDVKMGRRRVRNSEVIGYDKSNDTLPMYAFENGGTAGVLTGRIRGNKWHADNEKIRFRGKFSTDKKTVTGHWEYRAGKSWKLWISMRLEK